MYAESTKYCSRQQSNMYRGSIPFFFFLVTSLSRQTAVDRRRQVPVWITLSERVFPSRRRRDNIINGIGSRCDSQRALIVQGRKKRVQKYPIRQDSPLTSARGSSLVTSPFLGASSRAGLFLSFLLKLIDLKDHFFFIYEGGNGIDNDRRTHYAQLCVLFF